MTFAFKQLFSSIRPLWAIYGRIERDKCNEDLIAINDELKTINCSLLIDVYWRFVLKTPKGNCVIRSFIGNCGLLEVSQLGNDSSDSDSVVYWKSIFKLFATRCSRNLIIYNTEEGQDLKRDFLNKIGFVDLNPDKNQFRNNNSNHSIYFHVLDTNTIDMNTL